MINRPTGPELFRKARTLPSGQPASNAAVQALTAAILTLVDAVEPGLYEMDAWREVIPRPPLKECKSKDNRRPACAEWHTEDCVYADPVPEPVKQEPTGPRTYVQHPHGKQGHIVEFKHATESDVTILVQWYASGARPVWTNLSMLRIITADQVERCENGQTHEESGYTFRTEEF